MLKLWTAQYQYKGEYRTDITVKTATYPWNIFAPTWKMVMAYINGPKDKAAEQVYIAEYTKIVSNAFKTNGAELLTLLQSDQTRVLVCFCKPGAFCHRVLLARHFESLGAIYHGET